MRVQFKEKCPLLENENCAWRIAPYCVMLDKDPLAVTVEKYCHSKNHINCPVYIKTKNKNIPV